MKNIDINEINRKNEIVDNAIIKLKQDFIGIDEQIDNIMNQVRTWYVYPNLQTTPIVVCLWGLTGTGKTSVLKKIVQYLDIEQDMVYFNFAEINEMTSYEVEQNIEDQLSNEKSNRFFVYDEFQYAATLDGHGEEKDNKNGLKPFWELLDTGIIHKRMDYRSSLYVMKIITYMNRINSKCQMDIKDGIWVNSQECLKHFNDYEISQFNEVFNFECDRKVPKITPLSNVIDYCQSPSNDDSEEYKLLIKEHVLGSLFNVLTTLNECYFNKFETYEALTKMDYDMLYDFMLKARNNIQKGYDLKFNDSIIFIVGNLDEAYTIAFDVNPDMSPDQFHKISKKINVVDIKQALQKRFRNEQIARMGNSHIIYPAFSSKTFKSIIDLNLRQYGKKVYEMSGYKIIFDNTIQNIIYKESVFPTHGTRPIFSTIQELVKTKLPNVIRSIYEDKIENNVHTLKYSYKSNKITVSVFNAKQEKIKTYYFTIKLKLDNLRKSTKDEEQALCALHESGHFVVYTKLFGEMPEKLVSKTTDNNTGGFLMMPFDDKKVTSKDTLIKLIMVNLGGYVVEKKYFGENKMSCGASSDLENATVIASKMIRDYGMGTECAVTTYVKGGIPNSGYIICEDNQEYINNQIRTIIERCLEKTEKIFEDEEWCNMLQKSTNYLAEHSSMPKSKMTEIYNSVSDNKKTAKNDTFYRDRIKNITVK